MERDASPETRRGLNLTGLALVAAAVVVGLVLTAVVLQAENGRRAAQASTNTAAEPQPAPAPAAPAAAPAAPTSAATTAAPAKSAATSASTGTTAAGSTVYSAACGGCHPNGKAGLGPTLKGLSDAAITSAVRNGKGGMPAFGTAQLSDQQLQDMLAFLHTL